jgi:hypothetical protein
MGKKSGPGSGMNNPDHISESLETVFRVKILKFFYVDPGWKKFGSVMEKIRIRGKHPGSAKLYATMTEIKTSRKVCRALCRWLSTYWV